MKMLRFVLQAEMSSLQIQDAALMTSQTNIFTL